MPFNPAPTPKMPARSVPSALACGIMASLLISVGGCSTADSPMSQSFSGRPQGTGDFANIHYATWREDEPEYRLYPGDVLDVTAPSAPELTRTVVVQQDGRITLPLIAPVMAANRSVLEMEADLSQAYSAQLLRPEVDVSVKQSAPLKIFVGGEVKNPGVYDMPGDINALQGVIMAGGFLPTSRSKEVVVIRRGVDGQPMMRTVDLRAAIYHPSGGDAVALRRFDVIYVPRSTIAEIDIFVDQYLRQTLPIQFSYLINGQYATTK
jgi:protein involved in polysaccharide export with SLBB domain